MENVNIIHNDSLRPTQRKENKEIILKKIKEDVAIYEQEIEKIRKEAHNEVLLLRPNGNEIISVEEKYDNEILKLREELNLLTETYNQTYLKTTLPLYLHDKALNEINDEYKKAEKKIIDDIKKRERAVNAKTVNRPQREFEKELKELETKNKFRRKEIKKSSNLGKLAIAEELEFLKEAHQKNIDELTLKYKESIKQAELTILTKEDIKPELLKLKEEQDARVLVVAEKRDNKINKLVVPDKEGINSVVKELTREYKENKKELNVKIKALLKDKKAAVANIPKVELTVEEEKAIKVETKKIKKEEKYAVVKVKQEIKKIRGYRPRRLTYNRRKVLFGLFFVAPWIVGFGLLFVYPFIQSFYYSFFELTPVPGAIELKFVGLDNYIYAFQEHVWNDTSFKIELLNTLQESLINLLVLVIFSLFIAVLLNHEFRGRAIIRAIFFIPVILNSSAVSIALAQGGTLTDLLLQESAVGVFNLGDYLLGMGLGTGIINFVVGLIDRIYNIISLSGVPILLFLAAIQSVPKHLYEAATIEGATGYEQFWLITLPNVSPHIITVSIYAIVDTFLTSSVSTIITYEFNRQKWGLSSAMSWVYVGLIIVILLTLAIFAKIFKIGESHYEREK